MSRTILVLLLITLAVVGIVGGIGLWAYSGLFFYRTNDALVQENLASVDAKQPGTISDVSVKKGDTVNSGDKIATLQVQGKDGTRSIDLDTDISGTVFMVIETGAVVTRDYPVAVISQSGTNSVGQATVVAFVDESVLNRIRLNQDVDVKIDAYGNTIYTGKVDQIMRQAASEFSQQPVADYASGNFTKVSQRVPVLISLDSGPVNNDMLQGLSAEVVIHLL
jgi:multidrug resistance efflux pump